MAATAAAVAWTTGLTPPVEHRMALVSTSTPDHAKATSAPAVAPPSCRTLRPHEASVVLGHRVRRLPSDPSAPAECAFGWTAFGRPHVVLAVATGEASDRAGSAVPGPAWDVVYPQGARSPVAGQGTLSAPVRVRLDPGLVPGNHRVAARGMVDDITRALLRHA